MKNLITGLIVSMLAFSPLAFADSETVVKKTSVYNDGMNKHVVKKNVRVKHHNSYGENHRVVKKVRVKHTPYGWSKGVKKGWHHKSVPPGSYKKTTVIQHRN